MAGGVVPAAGAAAAGSGLGGASAGGVGAGGVVPAAGWAGLGRAAGDGDSGSVGLVSEGVDCVDGAEGGDGGNGGDWTGGLEPSGAPVKTTLVVSPGAGTTVAPAPAAGGVTTVPVVAPSGPGLGLTTDPAGEFTVVVA